jgi:hypothetical protein
MRKEIEKLLREARDRGEIVGPPLAPSEVLAIADAEPAPEHRVRITVTFEIDPAVLREWPVARQNAFFNGLAKVLDAASGAKKRTAAGGLG